MRGGLLKILESLPGAMMLEDTSNTWSVSALMDAVENGQLRPAKLEDNAYVLFTCRDGRQAIVMVEANGGLARNASYVEVR
jgi:hypothetical protein